MNLMIIDDKHAIKSDSSSWMVCKRGKDKEGEDTWTAISWYGSLEGAIQSLADLLLRTDTSTSLQELEASAERISKLFEGIPSIHIKVTKDLK